MSYFHKRGGIKQNLGRSASVWKHPGDVQGKENVSENRAVLSLAEKASSFKNIGLCSVLQKLKESDGNRLEKCLDACSEAG